MVNAIDSTTKVDPTLPLRECCRIYAERASGILRETNFRLKAGDFSTMQNGTPKKEGSGEAIHMGTSTLRNDTKDVQVLATNSFSKTISHTISTETTSGFEAGFSVSATLKIPLVGSTTASIHANFNSETSKGESTTVSFTYISPVQQIKVQPNSTVNVETYLQTDTFVGDVYVNREYLGQGNIAYIQRVTQQLIRKSLTFNDMYNVVKEAQKFGKVSGISTSHTKSPYFLIMGSGKFKVDCGTSFYCRVTEDENDSEVVSDKIDIRSDNFIVND